MQALWSVHDGAYPPEARSNVVGRTDSDRAASGELLRLDGTTGSSSSGPNPAASSAESASLAHTGSNITVAVGIGILAFILGAGAILMGPRRRLRMRSTSR